MKQYWKDPRLDDEGNYDYLLEELPQDTVKWSRFPQKCNTCEKTHKLNQVSTHYFYCYDGWDSISYSECWKCKLKGSIRKIISKVIKPFRKKTKEDIRAKWEKKYMKLSKKYN